jgi:CNT family concentrative nucleoside transporter
MERAISLLGLVVIMVLAWLMSSHKRRIPVRVIVGGLALQFVFAFLVLYTAPGQAAFQAAGDFFNQVLGFVEAGTKFVFGINADDNVQSRYRLITTFAFGVLPTIVFFSSLMAILYHLGVMQLVVGAMAWIMQRTLRTSGAETLSAAANIFLGQTEAPLLIKPYLAEMTDSELMAVMVGGFATVSGGILAAYVAFGLDAGHLITASVISAPASLVLAKIVEPEVGQPRTGGATRIAVPRTATNVIEAATVGASDGMKLAINVAAMLIAFLALIAMLDAAVGAVGDLVGRLLGVGEQDWSLSRALGYLCVPLAWLMGIEPRDCLPAGELVGLRMVTNEIVAYERLAEMMNAQHGPPLSPRSKVIMTYALSGFANLGSIGIQIAGIGGMAEERRADLARLGLRAMLAGTLATLMTGCVAGALIGPDGSVPQLFNWTAGR